MKGESAIETNLTGPTTNLVGWVKQTNLLNLYPHLFGLTSKAPLRTR